MPPPSLRHCPTLCSPLCTHPTLLLPEPSLFSLETPELVLKCSERSLEAVVGLRDLLVFLAKNPLFGWKKYLKVGGIQGKGVVVLKQEENCGGDSKVECMQEVLDFILGIPKKKRHNEARFKDWTEHSRWEKWVEKGLEK